LTSVGLVGLLERLIKKLWVNFGKLLAIGRWQVLGQEALTRQMFIITMVAKKLD